MMARDEEMLESDTFVLPGRRSRARKRRTLLQVSLLVATERRRVSSARQGQLDGSDAQA